MRVLAICDWGECRSVCMRNVLRKRGYCAYSLGTEQDDFIQRLLEIKPHQIIWMNEGAHEKDGWIGRDEWGNPRNKKLIKICEAKADELGFIERTSKGRIYGYR